MDEALERTMLFDFYGELLTAKQREYFHLHYNEDMSLSEIAESEGISRQGVWDNIRRAEESLRSLEQKTGLVARFEKQRMLLAQMDKDAAALIKATSGHAHMLAERLHQRIGELQNGI